MANITLYVSLTFFGDNWLFSLSVLSKYDIEQFQETD